MRRIPFYLPLLLYGITAMSAQTDCQFDADDADSPNFVDKIVDCENQNKLTIFSSEKDNVALLYDDGSVNEESGISERPVVAPGSLNHSPGKIYAAREAYSLRNGAAFEQSVTLAIHRLHLQMAHYCARGWTLEKQWSQPDPRREGDFYLHYRFRCAE